jgi:uncharacterized coiled-coil protein SlyX
MGPATSPEAADIIRLERQVAARDDVIQQLNRQLHELAPEPPDTEQDVPSEAMEEFVYKVRVLEDEIVRLRQEIQAGLAAPGRPAVSSEPAPPRSMPRRIASALKRRLQT